jgi:hypothetical protein
LTGQRNENSSLFSLDALSGLVLAPARAAPVTEGSGLVDIRAMRAMLDREAGGGAGRATGRNGNILPSFGEGGLGGLSADRLVTVAPTPATPVELGSRSSRGPLYALIGVLGFGFLGLGAVLVLDEPDREHVVAVAPAIEAVEPVEPVEPVIDEAPEVQAAIVSEPVAEVEPEPAKPEAPTRRKNKRTNKPASDKPSTASASPPSKAIDVDCLLNKKLPQCQGDAGTSKSPPDKKAAAPDTELANKLGQSEILAGVGPIKTAAKSCGSGTAVAIKFSVKGATGGVVSVSPLEEHSSSAVGKCVAAAAKQATFPKFQAEQQGFTFTFRL